MRISISETLAAADSALDEKKADFFKASLLYQNTLSEIKKRLENKPVESSKYHEDYLRCQLGLLDCRIGLFSINLLDIQQELNAIANACKKNPPKHKEVKDTLDRLKSWLDDLQPDSQAYHDYQTRFAETVLNFARSNDNHDTSDEDIYDDHDISSIATCENDQTILGKLFNWDALNNNEITHLNQAIESISAVINDSKNQETNKREIIDAKETLALLYECVADYWFDHAMRSSDKITKISQLTDAKYYYLQTIAQLKEINKPVSNLLHLSIVNIYEKLSLEETDPKQQKSIIASMQTYIKDEHLQENFNKNKNHEDKEAALYALADHQGFIDQFQAQSAMKKKRRFKSDELNDETLNPVASTQDPSETRNLIDAHQNKKSKDMQEQTPLALPKISQGQHGLFAKTQTTPSSAMNAEAIQKFMTVIKETSNPENFQQRCNLLCNLAAIHRDDLKKSQGHHTLATLTLALYEKAYILSDNVIQKSHIKDEIKEFRKECHSLLTGHSAEDKTHERMKHYQADSKKQGPDNYFDETLQKHLDRLCSAYPNNFHVTLNTLTHKLDERKQTYLSAPSAASLARSGFRN